MRVGVVLAVFLLVVFVPGARAQGTRTHVLAIGYNGTPPTAVGDDLHELRYADDDAVAFARLARDLGGHAIVLSALDSDTARRFPDLAQRVRPPLLGELQRAVRELNTSFESDRRQGLQPQVLVTYSGHGVAQAGQLPALALSDAMLTQDVLYRDVLLALKASEVHLVVDACHAEAVVRPRDAQAAVVPLAAGDLDSVMSKLTLRGLPHVGSMIAASAGAQTHEWERWQQGVFTHEVISGLRGAADVNGDLRVEYSEMAAFLSAANREVSDGEARIKALVTAPHDAPRVAIVDLGGRADASFLTGRPGHFGGLSIESEDGQRIADLRSESDHYVRLLVPSGRALFVRSASGEAEVTVRAGERISFAALEMHAGELGARGALDESLKRGLFASTYGPSYYRGFVDRGDDLQPVALAPPTSQRVDAALIAPPAEHHPPALAWTGLGVSGALLVASATFGVLAVNARADYEAADRLEQSSYEASERFDTYRTLGIGSVLAGVLTGGVTTLLFTQY